MGGQKKEDAGLYVAFLRAINVGGRTVRMERLRAAFEELGYANVATFIASGNVIFEVGGRTEAELETEIVAHLRRTLGFEVPTFLRTPAELAAIAGREAFAAERVDAAHGLYVGFLPSPPSAAGRAALLAHRSADDDFAIHGRDVYWLAARSVARGGFSGAALEKALGTYTTLRNISTVRKLVAKYPHAS